MELNEIEQLARQLIRRHGLGGWTFGFNRRRRSLGLCRYAIQQIELSRHFAIAHPESEIRDVILHEIAHALAGHKAAHGPHWKAICEIIGARPERCGEANMPAGRWNAECSGCGRAYSRYRRPLRNRTYCCPRCGSTRGELRFRASRQRA